MTQDWIIEARKHKWLIAITVMFAAVIEILDTTIVNVSLPQMMGSLGASSDQITWVLTSYIVSSAIVMVLTGFLVDRLGVRRLLLINIIGFMIASMMCGVAFNLFQIVFFRTLQGVFGASLVPLSQYVMRTVFPAEEMGKAMAIWGLGVMVAPVMGPTIGGYITEFMNWRWVFYINLPVCVFTFFMTLRYIQPNPLSKKPVDWTGLILMALGVGSLQMFLDRGNQEDWFNSKQIVFLCITFVLSLGIFIVRGLKNKNNIINLNVFRDRNFALSTLMLAFFVAAMFGMVSIQPLLLEQLMGIPSLTTGLLMAPRGLVTAVSMALTGGLLLKYFDPRKLLFLGIILTAAGTYLFTTYNLQTNMIQAIMLPSLLQGIGTGLFFIPNAALSLSTLKGQASAEGSGLFSFGRNIGVSLGISILSTVISREKQINWNQLGEHISRFNSNYWLWLHHTGFQATNPQTYSILAQTLSQQASMIAFIDAFKLAVFFFILPLPLIFLLKKPDPAAMKSPIEQMH